LTSPKKVGIELSLDEHDLRKRLKKKVVGLSVVERARKKWCVRISNIKEGDTNTQKFHLRVNARRRKNHIHMLKHNQGWVTDHKAKEEIIHEHSTTVIRRANTRYQDFN
jgi:hypothetical protein